MTWQLALSAYLLVGAAHAGWNGWRNRVVVRKALQELADRVDGPHAGLPISWGRVVARETLLVVFVIMTVVWLPLELWDLVKKVRKS